MRLGLALLLTAIVAGCASPPASPPPKPFPPVTISFPGEHHRVETNVSAQPGLFACVSQCYSVAGAAPATASFSVAAVADRFQLSISFPAQPGAVQVVLSDGCTAKPTVLQGGNAFVVSEPGDRPLCHDLRLEVRQPVADTPAARVEAEQAFPVDLVLDWWSPATQVQA